MEYVPRDDQNLSQALQHSPLYSLHPSPVVKRKHVDPATMASSHLPKRRRDDDPDAYDADNGQGSKHWTEEEKTRLFTWLLGPDQDEHWNALRAAKNSCLREASPPDLVSSPITSSIQCAAEVFENKKTYQALKGCYERNFITFKQIYALEVFHSNLSTVLQSNESDRIREYERRLQTARKAEIDIGNLSAKTIDHWHRIGWYNLFYQR